MRRRCPEQHQPQASGQSSERPPLGGACQRAGARRLAEGRGGGAKKPPRRGFLLLLHGSVRHGALDCPHIGLLSGLREPRATSGRASLCALPPGWCRGGRNRRAAEAWNVLPGLSFWGTGCVLSGSPSPLLKLERVSHWAPTPTARRNGETWHFLTFLSIYFLTFLSISLRSCPPGRARVRTLSILTHVSDLSQSETRRAWVGQRSLGPRP